jgi:hypothetical protein
VRTGNLALRRQVTLKKRVWVGDPVCPGLPSSTSKPTRAKKAARRCQHSLRRECSISGRFADALRRRQIAGVDSGSNWLPASGPFSLYIRAYWLGELHPRWSVADSKLWVHVLIAVTAAFPPALAAWIGRRALACNCVRFAKAALRRIDYSGNVVDGGS